MISLVDQIGRPITLDRPAQRIVSTVPSQTELLFDLGVGERVVGRSRFCVHPKSEVKTIPDVGGTKSLRIDLIHELSPDLIIANKEENERAQIEELERHYPVYISDVTDVDVACQMIGQVGLLIGKEEVSSNLAIQIKEGFRSLPQFNATAAYFIWNNPLMAVGNNTYIHHILKLLGFENIFGDASRYPEVDDIGLSEKSPEYVLLSSEPYPFKETHRQKMIDLLPDSKVLMVDGEMFSWYGSRMLKSIPYFKALYVSQL